MAATDLPDNNTDNTQSELDSSVFVSKRTDGLYINLQRMQKAEDFNLFVDRLFAGGSRFVGLDYAAFLKVLYDDAWLTEARKKTAELKIAQDAVRFPPQRQSLYRGVKILEGAKRAEYMFEPITVEVAYDEPVYGAPDEQGVVSVIKHVRTVKEEPGKLDFDEFVCSMWLKGVKFGIDEEAVRKAIAARDTARVPVARWLDATPGSDAEIQEACSVLHRDNSPKILANGKADLGAFANRFPQIGKGARLLKKVPCKAGKRGWYVSGEVIEPGIPKDLDLAVLSSTGTHVVKESDGE
ncbi:MAG TPA: flagellar assembly protein A, partial [Gallionella sp.]|nr:flagellar assembly protein A [Gallionella sp.]